MYVVRICGMLSLHVWFPAGVVTKKRGILKRSTCGRREPSRPRVNEPDQPFNGILGVGTNEHVNLVVVHHDGVQRHVPNLHRTLIHLAK